MISTPIIKPLPGQVLVRLMPEKQIGSITIPDADQEPAKRGVVVRLGPWKKNSKGLAFIPEVKRGDTVFFSHRRGRELDGLHRDFKLLKVDDILAVLGSV